MVDENWYAAIGIQAEEPIFLLFVGHDVAERWTLLVMDIARQR